MKYCPYCGADLPDGAVSFCSECGNALPGEKKNNVQPEKKEHKPDKKKTRPKRRKRKAAKPVPEASAEKTPVMEEDYDGYYDDVLPMDTGRQREGIDRSIIKKIAILIAGLVVVIGICVALMYLL
jgi:uncharacterized Zn finger protein (UPF0148 family)